MRNAQHDANAHAILALILIPILRPILHRARFPRVIQTKENPIHIETLSTKNTRAQKIHDQNRTQKNRAKNRNKKRVERMQIHRKKCTREIII